MRVAANFYVWLFGRKAFYGWNRRLLNLAVRGMGVGVPTDAMIGPGERRFMQRLSTLGAINVFDVGAHVGEFATRLRSSCPKARVWAFEPHPAARTRCASRVHPRAGLANRARACGRRS